MLSNQKLQSSLNEIKEITKLDVALYSTKGKVIANTCVMPCEVENAVADFADSLADKQVVGEY